MKRIATYCRVSTELQMNEKTIESQKEELIAYSRKNGFLIVESYADDGYSGELLARPDLDRLRDDAKAKKFDAVLVHAVDRLSRNHIHAGVVIEELQKNGVELIFLNAPPTDTPEGRLLFDIQSVVAQFEKEKIKERTRRGRLHKANKGLIVGNIPPYGYRYVKKEEVGFYEIDEEEAETVRLIFDLYTKKGFSLRGIRMELYKRGIRPPKGGQHWGSSTLGRLIGNESYAGVTHYLKNLSYEPLKRKTETYHRIKNTGRKLRPRDEWIPIAIPPIISREIFQAALSRRETNQRFASRNTKHPYLLRGLLEHLPCQYRMGCECHRGQQLYRCSERNNNFPEPKSCDGSYLTDVLDELVWDTVVGIITHPEPVTNYLRKKDKGRTKAIKAAQDTLQLLDRQVEEVKSKEEKIASEYASGILKPEQIATLMNGLDARRQKILEKKAYTEREIVGLGTPASVINGNLQKTLKLLRKKIDEAPFETKQAILKLLVEKITLEKQKAVIKVKIPAPLQSNRAIASQTFLNCVRLRRR